MVGKPLVVLVFDCSIDEFPPERSGRTVIVLPTAVTQVQQGVEESFHTLVRWLAHNDGLGGIRTIQLADLIDLPIASKLNARRHKN